MAEKEHTGYIDTGVAVIAVQALVGEAGPGHQPGRLAGHLRAVTVGVSENPIEHFAVANGVSSPSIKRRRRDAPDHSGNVVARKSARIGRQVLVRNNNKRHFIRRQSAPVSLRLSIRISLLG